MILSYASQRDYDAMTGLDRDMADYMARCMRLIHGVETVLTVESRPVS